MKKLKLLATIFFSGIVLLLSNSCKKTTQASTALGLPTVTTVGLASTTPTAAQFAGDVTSDGNQGLSAIGFCYSSTNTMPMITTDAYTTDGVLTGGFTGTLLGLYENTTYYVRAYATNPTGTAYGNVIAFQTAAGWVGQVSGTTNDLKGVYFIDASRGCAVGNNGTILKTTNNGNTWIAQTSGITTALNSVCFTDTSNGYVVGN